LQADVRPAPLIALGAGCPPSKAMLSARAIAQRSARKDEHGGAAILRRMLRLASGEVREMRRLIGSSLSIRRPNLSTSGIVTGSASCAARYYCAPVFPQRRVSMRRLLRPGGSACFTSTASALSASIMSLRAARCVRILEQGKCSPRMRSAAWRDMPSAQWSETRVRKAAAAPPTMRRQISSSFVQAFLSYMCTP